MVRLVIYGSVFLLSTTYRRLSVVLLTACLPLGRGRESVCVCVCVCVCKYCNRWYMCVRMCVCVIIMTWVVWWWTTPGVGQWGGGEGSPGGHDRMLRGQIAKIGRLECSVFTFEVAAASRRDGKKTKQIRPLAPSWPHAQFPNQTFLTIYANDQAKINSQK